MDIKELQKAIKFFEENPAKNTPYWTATGKSGKGVKVNVPELITAFCYMTYFGADEEE